MSLTRRVLSVGGSHIVRARGRTCFHPAPRSRARRFARIDPELALHVGDRAPHVGPEIPVIGEIARDPPAALERAEEELRDAGPAEQVLVGSWATGVTSMSAQKIISGSSAT